MANAILPLQSTSTQLQEHIEYPQAGVLSKVLLKANTCEFTLFCLAAGTEISEHTSTRHAVVQFSSRLCSRPAIASTKRNAATASCQACRVAASGTKLKSPTSRGIAASRAGLGTGRCNSTR
jgi:hypothetical protein